MPSDASLAVPVTDSSFGPGTGEIISVRWRCTGGESTLLDCPKDNRVCDHSRDAGVRCYGINSILIKHH